MHRRRWIRVHRRTRIREAAAAGARAGSSPVEEVVFPKIVATAQQDRDANQACHEHAHRSFPQRKGSLESERSLKFKVSGLLSDSLGLFGKVGVPELPELLQSVYFEPPVVVGQR